jgi:hypothetical protein
MQAEYLATFQDRTAECQGVGGKEDRTEKDIPERCRIPASFRVLQLISDPLPEGRAVFQRGS